ncbi:MAG: hypothetical protein ACI9W2_001671 [Gammaproteobacteria bacterium]
MEFFHALGSGVGTLPHDEAARFYGVNF